MMDIELARERAILIDKGFEYYKLYRVGQRINAAQDSIISIQQGQLSDKDQQLENQIAITHKAEIQSMNNLELAKMWKKKARSPKGWVIPGLVGLFGGLLFQFQ